MNIVLVGIGGMGYVHFCEYQKIDNCKVVAVVDVRKEMAIEKVKDSNIHVYDTMEKALEKEKADVVDICTPSYMHADMSVTALEHGCHVLCEKPMSLSTSDCDRVIKSAKRCNRLFMTAHVVRFSKAYMYLRDTIKSERLGGLLDIKMKRLSGVPRWSWNNWMQDLKKSGGTPLDLGIHDLDFILYTLGEPKEIKSVYHPLRDDNDFFCTQLIYNDYIVTTQGAWYNCDYQFEASFSSVFQNGTVDLKNNILYENGVEVELDGSGIMQDSGINIKAVDGYGAEIEYFISCVKNKILPAIVLPESSKSSVALAEKIINEATIIL